MVRTLLSDQMVRISFALSAAAAAEFCRMDSRVVRAVVDRKAPQEEPAHPGRVAMAEHARRSTSLVQAAAVRDRLAVMRQLQTLAEMAAMAKSVKLQEWASITPAVVAVVRVRVLVALVAKAAAELVVAPLDLR